MSLPSDLKLVIETRFPTSEIVFSSWFLANRNSHDLDESKLTTAAPYIIIFNDADKNKAIQPNANVLSDTLIQVQILAQDTKDANSEESQIIIDALEPLADNIAGIIYRKNNIRLEGAETFRYKVKPMFKRYNSILTGVQLEIRAKENQLISFCTEP